MKSSGGGWGRLWPYFKPQLPCVVAAGLAGVLRFTIPLTVPWAFKIVIDEVLAPGVTDASRRLFEITFFLIAVHVVWIAASYMRLYFTGLAGARILHALRRSLYAHIQKMSLEFFESRRTGAIVSRLMNEMTAIQQFLTQGVTSAAMDAFSIAIAGGLMFAIDPRLALVSFLSIPVYMLASRIFMEKVRVSSRVIQEQAEILSADLHEKIAAIPVIQAFSQEKKEEKIFLRYCGNYFASVMRNIRLQSAGLSLTGFLAGLTPVVVVGYGGWLVLDGYLSAGELAAFYAYAGFVYMPLNRLMELNAVTGNARAAMDRIFEILDLAPAVAEHPGAIHVSGSRGRISFEGVSFAYSAGLPVLNRLDLELEPEECVALTGPSGCGKTTLAKLLLRFYDVKEGVIRIDGRDIREFTLPSLRSQIAWVPQEPVLFSGTILDNILYARPGAPAQEAVEAARAAHAHEFIMRLPNGYGTLVGERGMLLSAGEKQRIAIARAFLKNAPVLILDEPSSALDETSERLISAGLRELKRGKTALIISHRLSMMEDAGRTFRLWKGKACEVAKDGLPSL